MDLGFSKINFCFGSIPITLLIRTDEPTDKQAIFTMKNLTLKLENALIGTRGLVRISISELLIIGITSTGKNQNRKSQKWTKEVCEILTKNNISFENGNNAPKGGVCGEFVKITNKSFLLNIAKTKKLAKIDYRNSIDLTDKLFLENFNKIKNQISKKYPNFNFSHQDSKTTAFHINNKFFESKCNTIHLSHLIREQIKN